MRRIPVLLAALALLLMVAVPATAAPGTQWKSLTYDVACGDQTWVVKATGTPGFPVIENTTTAPPLLLLGGHLTITVGSDILEIHDPYPPGLEGKLMDCTIDGPSEDVGFTLVVDPAWIFVPGTH